MNQLTDQDRAALIMPSSTDGNTAENTADDQGDKKPTQRDVLWEIVRHFGPGSLARKATATETDDAANQSTPTPSADTNPPALETKWPELSTGAAAELRRGGQKALNPYFWWVWNNLGLEKLGPKGFSKPDQQDRWALVLQAYALLLPRGKDNKDRRLPNDSKIRLGHVMRGDGERARVSERRVARLLNAPIEKRPGLMMRLLPLLKDEKFNLVELGQFLLNPDETAVRRIASDYYR